MKKYALYIRTATNDTEAVLAQQHSLTAHVKRQPNALVKGMFMDVGHSGLKHDRAGLTELMRWIDRGDVNTVLVVDKDRLSRDVKELLNLLRAIKAAGATLEIADDVHEEVAS